jgi:hypothetical protein
MINNIDKLLNMDRRQYISFMKSVVRILGFTCLFFNIYAASSFLIAAEFLGIVKELF